MRIFFPRLSRALATNARLRADNARLKRHNDRLCDLLAYQRGRMKETAAESLGMRVALAQMAPPVRRPVAVDTTVALDRVVAR